MNNEKNPNRSSSSKYIDDYLYKCDKSFREKRIDPKKLLSLYSMTLTVKQAPICERVKDNCYTLHDMLSFQHQIY